MESKFKKILLQSTVFTCLSSGVNVTMALDADRETTASKEYHTHHAANFISITEKNPAMAAIKKQQLEHRATIKADATLMLKAIKESLDQSELDFNRLINMITAALTADADAINDIEDKHEAKKTATVPDTAETLTIKADEYNTAKDQGLISKDIQHYRLAYFLMLKLQPWLAGNYKNDPIEANILLKDHIPTHYPEWISTSVLTKELTVTLQENTVTPIGDVTVNFPVSKTIPNGTKVYKYNGSGGTEVKTASVETGSGKTSTKISGLTDYGVYYIGIDTHKYYFSVDKTKADEFIYGSNVKIDSIPNNGLKSLGITPTLALKLGSTTVNEETFSVSLNGTDWTTLSALATTDFLKADKTVYFKDLNAGTYTFEVTSPTPERFAAQRAYFTVLPKIISPTATANSRHYIKDDKLATAEINSGSDYVIVNKAEFDTDSVGANKEVTVSFSVISSSKNYLVVPRYSTTANITAVVVDNTPTGGTPTGDTPTGPSIEFVEIVPNTGSPYLKATGTVENIAAGDYIVSISSDSNDDATGTIVVDDNGNFKVSLLGLTFAATGEEVTVTITTDGPYKDMTLTFTTPVITPNFTDAADGSGSVEFTVPTAFNGITPTVVAAFGNAVTGYTGVTAIASAEFTRIYTTDTVGSFIPRGRINMLGTNFKFTAAPVNSQDSSISYNFILNTYNPNDSMTSSLLTIADQTNNLGDGESVTNIVVHDIFNDQNIPIDTNTVTSGGGAFNINLSNSGTLENDAEISFEISGQKYMVLYSVV